jgi:glycosyltransferase involved in cell wall biosynthesis
MVADKGLLDRVCFTGRVSDEDLLEILSSSDVCVNPDRPSEMNDLSTMIKITEYMALGKPIVQFDAKVGRFSAQEASLYAAKDEGVADFAAKIIWLLDRPEERKWVNLEERESNKSLPGNILCHNFWLPTRKRCTIEKENSAIPTPSAVLKIGLHAAKVRRLRSLF